MLITKYDKLAMRPRAVRSRVHLESFHLETATPSAQLVGIVLNRGIGDKRAWLGPFAEPIIANENNIYPGI